MATNPKIVLGALNISADPHPAGIYRQLFHKASDQRVRLWGNDWAKITEPQDRGTSPPSFYARVLVWTEIDKDGKWLNQDENREATPNEKRTIQIPEVLDPNLRSFNFVFLEDRHLLIVEFQNELGEHFGAKRAERLFSMLLADEDPPDEEPIVSVTVVPSREALDRIYAIPKLRRLEIFLTRPNPDDLDAETNRVLDRLVKQGAKSQTLELAKQARVKKITPDGETQTLASVAATNGYVAGEGKREDGTTVFESTKDHPLVVTLEVKGSSSIGTFFANLGLF